jgi:hypothetical protein
MYLCTCGRACTEVPATVSTYISNELSSVPVQDILFEHWRNVSLAAESG